MRPKIRKPTPGRILASIRFHTPVGSDPTKETPQNAPLAVTAPLIPPTASVWQQYGAALVEQYPRDQWPERLRQVPSFYRGHIRTRLIRDYGYQIEVTKIEE